MPRRKKNLDYDYDSPYDYRDSGDSPLRYEEDREDTDWPDEDKEGVYKDEWDDEYPEESLEHLRDEEWEE